jgi:hypothetical protein
MVTPPNFVQFTAKDGIVYGLNVSAVCCWQYYPAVLETEHEEGRPSRLIVTVLANEDVYRDETADYFYTHLKGHSKEWWAGHV